MGVEKPTAVGKLPVVESQVNGGHSKVCFARPPLNLSGECHILQTFEQRLEMRYEKINTNIIFLENKNDLIWASALRNLIFQYYYVVPICQIFLNNLILLFRFWSPYWRRSRAASLHQDDRKVTSQPQPTNLCNKTDYIQQQSIRQQTIPNSRSQLTR